MVIADVACNRSRMPEGQLRVYGTECNDVYALNCFPGTGRATFWNRDLSIVARDNALNVMLTARTTQASVGGCESRCCRSMMAEQPSKL